MKLFAYFAGLVLSVTSATDLGPIKPQINGSWEPVIQLRDASLNFLGTVSRPKPKDGWWVTPIHASLLKTGMVLINGWGRYDHDNCRVFKTRQNGTSFILDPNKFTGGSSRTFFVNPISEAFREGTQDVLYCSGHVPMPDGRILFTGGARYENLGDKDKELEYGLNYLRIFDPNTNAFSRIDNDNFRPGGSPDNWPGMPGYEKGMMWYPTETRLPGGRVFVTGGFTGNCGVSGPHAPCFNRDLEILNPETLDKNQNPWGTWVNHQSVDAVNNYDPGIKDYTHTFLLYEPLPAEKGGVQGDLLLMGQQGRVNYVSIDDKTPAKQRLWKTEVLRPGKAAAWDSTAVLVGTGKILTMGGGPNAKLEAQRIDLYDPHTGEWRSFNTGITRHNPSTTLLPDGTVLILNGEPGDDVANAMGSRKQPQIFDPYTDPEKLTTLAAWPDENPQERGYHSFSLLLRDGRIMLGGGMVTLAMVGCERPDVRIFNPPYLFNENGQRPTIVSPLLPIHIGKDFRIAYSGSRPRKTRGLALMALGSETHSFDQNQRYIPLEFDEKDGALYVNAPKNSTIAPEGYYNLFLISEKGTPSEGVTVQVVSD